MIAGAGNPFPVGGGAIVLEVTGRVSGEPRQVPLLATRLGDKLMVSTVRSDSQWLRNIKAEAALQAFYVGFAVYGAWLSGMAQDWTPQSASLEWHLTALGLTTIATASLGFIMKRYTTSALPWTDAFTTVFSIWATWLMVHNHHANWAYWIAIDAVAIVLYAKRGLPMGAALYAIYLVMAVIGWFRWDV